MELPVTLPGLELRRIVVQTGGLFSSPRILIDGDPAPKGPKAGQVLLRRNDGAEVVAQLRRLNFLDPVPQLIVDGQTVSLAEPLKWYQWLWGGLPFALVIVGGALGALFGALALLANGRLFRSRLNSLLKYLATAGVSLAAVAGYFASAVVLQAAVVNFFARPETLTSAAGRFAVTTPIKLKETTQTVTVPGLGPLEVHTFAGQRGDIGYYVSYSDYPADVVGQMDPAQVLAGSRDGASRSVNGTITADAALALAGHPGREFVVAGSAENGQALVIKSRIFLVENRLYQLMAITPPGQAGEAGVDEFLLSFKLLGE